MSQSTTRKAIANCLENHPRLMGALFTMALLLTQAGNTAANCCSATNGP